MWNVWGPIIAVLLASYLGLAGAVIKRFYSRMDHLDECLDEMKEAFWRHLAIHHPHLLRTRKER